MGREEHSKQIWLACVGSACSAWTTLDFPQLMKVMTNLDSILKSRDITLSKKVHLVKAMVFPVVCMDVKVGL